MTYIRDAVAYAAEYAFTHGTVSADDIRDQLGEPPDRHSTGAVFANGKWWKAVRQVPSRHPGAHGRRINKYILTAEGRRTFRYLDPDA